MSKRGSFWSRRNSVRRIHTFTALGIALVFGAFAAAVLGNNLTRAAGNGKIYLTPASGTARPGESVTVDIRVDSGSDEVNGAGVEIAYDESQFTYQSFSAAGSAYGVEAPNDVKPGSIRFNRGNINTIKGDQFFGKATFKTLKAGTLQLNIGTGSEALRASDQVDVIGTRTGSSFAVSEPTPPNPSPTTPAPAPAPTRANAAPAPPRTATSSTSAPRTTGQTISMTPQGSTAQTPVPSDSTVQVSAPTTLQPADDTGSIDRVEYYLKGKLIATVKQPPFSYQVDTAKLRNGSYELTTKTYKSDGSIATAKHTLNVANPLNLAQIAIQAKYYWWLLAIIAILMVDVITTLYLRHKNGGTGSLLDTLMPWRRKQPELNFAQTGYTTGADAAPANPYFNAPPVQPSGTVPVAQQPPTPSESKLEHFTPNLPQAGQVVAPRPADDKKDSNDPYNLLPR